MSTKDRQRVEPIEETDNLQIRGKLGTHSTAVYEVRDTEELPRVGDMIEIRSDYDPRVRKWTWAIVHEIKAGNFFFLGMR